MRNTSRFYSKKVCTQGRDRPEGLENNMKTKGKGGKKRTMYTRTGHQSKKKTGRKETKTGGPEDVGRKRREIKNVADRQAESFGTISLGEK